MQEKKLDIFHFIGFDKNGKSLSIYNFLENQLHVYPNSPNLFTNDFLEEYSFSSLLCRYQSYFEDIHSDSLNKFYKDFLKHPIEYLRNSLQLDYNSKYPGKSMSEEERIEFFQDAAIALQKENLDDSNLSNRMNGLLSKLERDPDAFADPYYTPNGFTSLIIRKGISVMPENAKADDKNMIVGIYLTSYLNYLKKLYPTVEERNGSEVYQVASFINFLVTHNKIGEYDSFLTKFKIGQNRVVNEFADSYIADSIKERFIKDSLNKGLSAHGIKAFSYPLDVIYPSDKIPTPKKGSFNWRVDLFDKPIVIMDGLTTYPEHSSVDVNQRVIAISYGKFVASNDILTNEANELIGITRIRKNNATGMYEKNNYFVLAPMRTFSLQSDRNMPDTHVLKLRDEGYRKTSLKDNFGSSIYYKPLERIPSSLTEFYKNVAFSDTVLDKAILDNYRFLGSVEQDEEKISLRASSKYYGDDISACRYASLYPGKVNNRIFASLDDFVNSANFFTKHIQLVFDIANGFYNPEKVVKDESRE